MSIVSGYRRGTIGDGDARSRVLRDIITETVAKSPHAELFDGAVPALLRQPRGTRAVIHTAAGDRYATSAYTQAETMLRNLRRQASVLGARPVAFADVIDTGTLDERVMQDAMEGLIVNASLHRMACLNGELAVMPDRIRKINISGTAISLLPREADIPDHPFVKDGVTYIPFTFDGRAAAMFSDGVGSKTEIYARMGLLTRALQDSLAMKVDDAVKAGAQVIAVSDIIETYGQVDAALFHDTARMLGASLGFSYGVQRESVGGRIKPWNPAVPFWENFDYNISGSALAFIDDCWLRATPTPQAGQTLIAISNPQATPRSNGITPSRQVMEKLYGFLWHQHPEGRACAEQFLARPSTVFYPLFHELLEHQEASAVYHMSGGALDGKLARPLAEHGLFVAISDLFPPSQWQKRITDVAQATLSEAYSVWPMGNEGYIATSTPEAALERIERSGLMARPVARIELAVDGRTGVELRDIRERGVPVYYSGKAA